MLVLDAFDRSRTRDTLASRGSRADTHYHIVATFEAKESGALGVLTQSLGISGRLEWLSQAMIVVFVFVLNQLYLISYNRPLTGYV